jgi:HSP20 family protein
VYGQFERLVHLPAEVDHERISAKFENGVLEVRAPKQEPEPRGAKVGIR